LFGEWIEISEWELLQVRIKPLLNAPIKTPEEIIIEREWLEGLSEEGREVVNIILECPEEFFFSNGKLIMSKFILFCEQTKNWDSSKVRDAIKEVARCIRI
jgi:hypothetical protein